jgi:hypothetical protein
MKARKHRGGFAESMATMKAIPATLDAVAEYFEVPVNQIYIPIYYGQDNREGWGSKTRLVSSKHGVLGMISEEIKQEKKK